MTTTSDMYTTYGSAHHRGHWFPVTSSPVGQSSAYALRAWKTRPGRDLVVSIRNPSNPEAEWHPEFKNTTEVEKAEFVSSVVQVFLKWKARR